MKRILFVCLVLTGCGSVTSVDVGADDGATGDTLGTVKPEVKPETAPEAPADVKPEAPPPGRPLGAGCSEDMQCGSNICVAVDVSSVCCDARPVDACTTCVGGYATPLKDGSVCGPGEGPPWECRVGRCVLK